MISLTINLNNYLMAVNHNIRTCLQALKQTIILFYSLHINCGGKEVTINGAKFDGDESAGKPSEFVSSKTNWAFSNTGVFLKDTRFISDYIQMNQSLNYSTPYSKLYETARVSPISLTYYAYCFANGNYTISLHFAEIDFTNAAILGSSERHIFNVYIQGKLVLKDFSIVDAAGGVLKPLIKGSLLQLLKIL